MMHRSTRPFRWMAVLAMLLIASTLRAASPDAVSPQTEAAIDRALRYLADKQQPDGTWKCDAGRSTAVTSLCTLAFLARGHVPGQGPYGQKIEKSIDFILDSQQPGGMLSVQNQNMYDHGASTVLLCEAYGMLDDARRAKADIVLGKAIKLILDAQKRTQAQYTGGWHYQPTQNDADLSCSGWQIVALRGCANCGATIPRDALDKAALFLHQVAVPSGGFAYQPGGGPNRARTGTGILCFCLLGKHTAPEAIAGGDYLIRNPLNNPGDEFYYYSVYYCSQAANQLGGKYWDTIYPTLRDTLLSRQRPNGAWPPPGNGEAAGGSGYSTAMSVLALCVPYQYLPLYQK